MNSHKSPYRLTTQRAVDDLPFAQDSSHPVYYRDADLKGFGVKATPHKKVYFAERRVGDRNVRAAIDSCTVISLKDARNRAMGLLAEMHQGNNPNAAKRAGRHREKTFLEVCEEYLLGRQLKEGTRKDYRRHMRKTLLKWADRSFLSIDREMVEKAYREAVTRTVITATGEGHVLTAAQANQAFRFARAVFNFAKRYHGEDGRPLLGDNPVDVLSQGGLWRRVAQRTRYIKASQLQTVWEALWKRCNTERALNVETARDLLILLMFTGLRLNEARLLRWVDVDMKEGVLTIQDPKNGQPHTLPFSDYLWSFFRRRQQISGVSAWVFPSEVGGRKKPITELRGVLDVVCAESGVMFTSHDLRRSFLTYSKELPAKYGPFFTKRLANHKVSDVTAGYVQISQQELRKCMQDITNYILEHASANVTRIGMLEPPSPPMPVPQRKIRLRHLEKEVVVIKGGGC
jgi:integrase